MADQLWALRPLRSMTAALKTAPTPRSPQFRGSNAGFREAILDPSPEKHFRLVDEIGPTTEDAVFAPGARARAILRGKEIAARDLKQSGGSYGLEDVRKLFNGVTRQSVEKRVREGALLAVPGPNNKRFYPVAQFDDSDAVVEGLSVVMKALRTDNAFSVLNFLVNPSSRLDNAKPIDLLKRGDVQKVFEAARRDGEQGA